MSFVADRMQAIDASGIRKVFALAAKMQNPINLSIGQPDYDVDSEVKLAAIDAIQSGKNAYTQTWGIEPLRDAFAAYYAQRFGVALQNPMVTSGVSGGLYLALLASVNPGDEVVFADPYFVMYPHLTRLMGGVPVPVDTYPDFHLTRERVEAVLTERTKVLILNSPANPTGVSVDASEMRALAALAEERNLLLISDEIYEALEYDHAPSTIAGTSDNVLLLNGLSKSAGMTGWRVGFAAGPAALIDAMNTLQQYSFVCAPAPAQWAGVQALKQDIGPHLEAYRRKRDIAFEGLSRAFEVTKPTGAFYAFPRAPHDDGDAFVTKAIENNVLIIPGSVFSARASHFRVSFAADDAVLKEGIDTLCRLADQHAGVKEAVAGAR